MYVLQSLPHSVTTLYCLPYTINYIMTFNLTVMLCTENFKRYEYLRLFFRKRRLHKLKNYFCVILQTFFFLCLFVLLSLFVFVYVLCVYVLQFSVSLFSYFSIAPVLWTVCPCYIVNCVRIYSWKVWRHLLLVQNNVYSWCQVKINITIYLNLTFDGVFFSLIYDGGGLILSTLFQIVKIIEKANFWDFFCVVKYNQLS